LKLIPDNTSIDFLNRAPRRIAMTFAALLVVASLASLIVRGMEFGIDFTGGVLLEVGYPEEANLDRIRQLMAESGFDDVQVQRFGAATDVMLRLPPQPDLDPNAVRESLSDVLEADNPGVQLRRVEFVGPQVGEDLREQGITAVIFALCLIFIYIMFRFQWKFSAGAVAALLHDIIITLGFFSIFGLQFDLTVLAGLLAVIGYSLNDTVVVFDRIRENFISMRGATTLDAMNRSINDTLSRTIVTGITTLMVLVALWYLGGESVRSFSTALIVGIIVGTFSSVYVASGLSLSLGISAKDLLPPEKDSKLIDDLP
jgi:preprotein translocase subunit SecF